MNRDPHNLMPDAANTHSGEETLRLIARLPVPDGLEERTHKALREAPRKGRLVAWPGEVRSRLSLRSNSMRTAAAAAIVFVVLGGGWGIYNRVQPAQSGKTITMPARMPASGGFAGAGAIRTPETLPGPTVNERVTKGAGARDQRSRPAKNAKGPVKGHSASRAEPAPQPAAPHRAESDQ